MQVDFCGVFAPHKRDVCETQIPLPSLQWPLFEKCDLKI